MVKRGFPTLMALACVALLAGTVVYRHLCTALYVRRTLAAAAETTRIERPWEAIPAQKAGVVVAGSVAEVAPRAYKLHPDPDRRLLWEAEHPNRLTGTFEILPAEGASQEMALWVREGTGRNNLDYYGPPQYPNVELGLAEYQFDVPRDGRYRLFLRMWAGDECSNSCWVAMDSNRDFHYFPGGVKGRFGAGNWRWPHVMFRRWVWMYHERFLYHLDAGPHRLRLEVREDGVAIDQIALVPSRAPWPSGVPDPTLIPNWRQRPADAPLSLDTPSTHTSEVTTPFDAFLAVSNHSLTPDSAPATDGWLCLRGNVAEPLEVNVELTCPGTTISPGQRLRCTLSGEAPFARMPVSVTFPAEVKRRAFDLKVTATCADYPELTVVRSCRVERPLDWWVLGPLTWEQGTTVAPVLQAATEIDLTRSPVSAMPALTWTQVRAPEHYNNFGALDFARVFGPRDRCVAYVATRIHVAEPGPYGIVGAGDDRLQLWCDGNEIFHDPMPRPLTDNIRKRVVELGQGDHLLVARVTQEMRYWQMLVQFGDTEWKPTGKVYGLPMVAE